MLQASRAGPPNNTGDKDLCHRIIFRPPWEAMEGRAGDPKGTGGAHKVQDGVAKGKDGPQGLGQGEGYEEPGERKLYIQRLGVRLDKDGYMLLALGKWVPQGESECP
ncbi:hypothetical protein Fcan01_14161 [Folsomia candida]|uniref:Uncharacterized protein n=1 Tax=Folsomia candida TaxID=158441 RepID=A0A226E1H9_FOLCA|nr:hypothetical protein Fcan01_14161 [Folsomia candida]